MKGHKNVLLIELIAVIFFFAISTVVTLQVFAQAFMQSRTSVRMTYALTEATSWAERFAKADDVESEMAKWANEARDKEDGYYLTLTTDEREMAAGKMIYFTLMGYDTTQEEEQFLFSMPVARYVPGSGAGI